MMLSKLKAMMFLVFVLALLAAAGCDEEESLPLGTMPAATACQPLLLSPSDNDTVYDNMASLSWNFNSGSCVDPEQYTVLLSLLPDGSNPVTLNTTKDTITATGLLMDTLYYWRIVGYGEHADTSVSAIRRLYTETQFPGMAYLPSPSDLAVDVDMNADLSWSIYDAGGKAFTYDLWFDYDNMKTPVVTGLTDTTFEPDILDPNRRYLWRVRAISEDADTVDGPFWEFTVEPPPPIYTILEIENQILDPYPGYSQIRNYLEAGFYLTTEMLNPLQAGGVTVYDVAGDTTYTLTWKTDKKVYSFTESVTPFITNDAQYTFNIAEGGALGEFSVSETFLSCGPRITNLPPYSFMSKSAGYELEWTNTCDGSVNLIVMKDEDTTGVYIQTDNDGSYLLTADDFAPIGTGTGAYIVLLVSEREAGIVNHICASESAIRVKSYHKIYDVILVP
ncbi:MAG: hypothetical protein AB1483_07980 [Candidatus Zixiibacteriota bacterium]